MAAETNPNIAPRLLVVGCGSLANALVPHLRGMPWGGITLIDGDRVETRNLERQPLFTEDDIGKPKCKVLKAWLRGEDPRLRVGAMDEFFDMSNAGETIPIHDIVADCTDDAHVKRMIDKKCGEYGLALVSGSVHGPQAQVIVLHAEGEGRDLSRDDLFAGKLGGEQDGCDMRYVPLNTINKVGARMAALLQDLMQGRPVVNGQIDLFADEGWTAIAPPET